MRIGLVQTRGLGDIIIALPLAQYLIDRGHEVIWPIDARFLASFRNANTAIRFLAVAPPASDSGPSGPRSYFLDEPTRLLRHQRCDVIHILYSFLSGVRLPRQDLAEHLKFDEYKYAVAGVPFSEKWRLAIRREAAREQSLFQQVAPAGPYAVMHSAGSSAAANPASMRAVAGGLPVVEIKPLTDNIFDWLLVIERASHLLLIDSCYSNLVEQLGLATPKHLWLRSSAMFTPVYRNGWSFVAASGGADAPSLPPDNAPGGIRVSYSVG